MFFACFLLLSDLFSQIWLLLDYFMQPFTFVVFMHNFYDVILMETLHVYCLQKSLFIKKDV